MALSSTACLDIPMLIPVLLVRRVEAGPPRRCNVPSAMSPMPLAMLCHALPRLQDPPRSPVVTAAQPWRSVSANDSRGDAGVLASSSPETSQQQLQLRVYTSASCGPAASSLLRALGAHGPPCDPRSGDVLGERRRGEELSGRCGGGERRPGRCAGSRVGNHQGSSKGGVYPGIRLRIPGDNPGPARISLLRTRDRKSQSIPPFAPRSERCGMRDAGPSDARRPPQPLTILGSSNPLSVSLFSWVLGMFPGLLTKIRPFNWSKAR